MLPKRRLISILGWADRGAVYRYEIDALSDVMLMDQKAPPRILRLWTGAPAARSIS
jgi:hypothetical protein